MYQVYDTPLRVLYQAPVVFVAVGPPGECVCAAVAVGTIVLQHSAVGNPFIYCKHVFGDDLLGIGA